VKTSRLATYMLQSLPELTGAAPGNVPCMCIDHCCGKHASLRKANATAYALQTVQNRMLNRQVSWRLADLSLNPEPQK
jgi:hypothetical protein